MSALARWFKFKGYAVAISCSQLSEFVDEAKATVDNRLGNSILCGNGAADGLFFV